MSNKLAPFTEPPPPPPQKILINKLIIYTLIEKSISTEHILGITMLIKTN